VPEGITPSASRSPEHQPERDTTFMVPYTSHHTQQVVSEGSVGRARGKGGPLNPLGIFHRPDFVGLGNFATVWSAKLALAPAGAAALVAARLTSFTLGSQLCCDSHSLPVTVNEVSVRGVCLLGAVLHRILPKVEKVATYGSADSRSRCAMRSATTSDRRSPGGQGGCNPP